MFTQLVSLCGALAVCVNVTERTMVTPEKAVRSKRTGSLGMLGVFHSQRENADIMLNTLELNGIICYITQRQSSVMKQRAEPDRMPREAIGL